MIESLQSTGVLFSLSVGTVLPLGIRRWAGKFQSELAMLREKKGADFSPLDHLGLAGQVSRVIAEVTVHAVELGAPSAEADETDPWQIIATMLSEK